MSASPSPGELPLPESTASETTRREFLGRGAAMAAVAVAAPVLAACDAGAVTEATGAAAAPTGGPLRNETSVDPWWTVHKQIVATIGAATNVKVPTLERVSGGYLQRVIVDDERVGTGLATILKSSHRFDTATLYVSVENSKGYGWKARAVYTNEDLVYAMCEGLSTNTLADGVLQESLKEGNPVVAIIKPSVVQFFNSVASDYYGNHLQVASKAFCDIFNGSVGGFSIASTTRDLSRC